MIKRHFAGHLAKQNHGIDMGNGGIKRQGDFVLRGVLFGGDQIQRHADVLGFVPDRIGETARVGEVAGAVTHTAGGIIGGDAAVGRADESVGFKLDPDFGGEAVSHAATARFRAERGHIGIGVPSLAYGSPRTTLVAGSQPWRTSSPFQRRAMWGIPSRHRVPGASISRSLS